MAERILNEDLVPSDLALHIDETPWKIQSKHEKDGFMWIISNRYGAYYFFKPTRSGQELKEKLGPYSRPAVTDGFSGYSVLEEIGIAQALCWARARRESIKIEGHDPSVKPILDLMDRTHDPPRSNWSKKLLRIWKPHRGCDCSNALYDHRVGKERRHRSKNVHADEFTKSG